MGRFFTRNPLTWVSFPQKYLKHGSVFQNFQVLAMQTPENYEKSAYISSRIPKNVYLFLPE